MSDIAVEIETHQHRFMRAWTRGDRTELRGLMTRDCIMIVGAARPDLLDRKSFLEACESGFTCSAYRLREVAARKYGKSAWLTAGIDMDLRIEGRDWSGQFWITDLWRKSTIGRSWKLAERSIARMEPDAKVMQSIHRLQLWK